MSMSKSVISLLLLGLAAVLASGCSELPPRVEATPAAMAKVKSIAVVRPPETKTYAVVDLTPSVAEAFGLIGALVASSAQDKKQEKLTAAIKAQPGLPPVKTLADVIAAQLAKHGFSVTETDSGWVQEDGQYKFDPAKLDSGADAVLLVEPRSVGFLMQTSATGFQPAITATVTLLGKDRKETLYRGYHSCNWGMGDKQWKNVSTPGSFADFDKVLADPKMAAGSLNSAAGLVAASVAEDIRH